MINRLLTITLIISVLLFGSVEIWSSTAIQFLVFTLGLIWILKGEYREYQVAGANQTSSLNNTRLYMLWSISGSAPALLCTETDLTALLSDAILLQRRRKKLDADQL